MVTDLRLVRHPKGHMVLQAEHSIWGGEGHEWRNVWVVEYENLSDYEKREINQYDPTENLRNL